MSRQEKNLNKLPRENMTGFTSPADSGGISASCRSQGEHSRVFTFGFWSLPLFFGGGGEVSQPTKSNFKTSAFRDARHPLFLTSGAQQLERSWLHLGSSYYTWSPSVTSALGAQPHTPAGFISTNQITSTRHSNQQEKKF